MKRSVPIFLQTSILLIAFGISVQGQPRKLDLPTGSSKFASVGEYLYFTWPFKTNIFLYRTDGTTEGTIFLRSLFFQDPSAFSELNGMAIWVEDNACGEAMEPGTTPFL